MTTGESRVRIEFNPENKEKCHAILYRSNEIAQMMKVIGEEGTSLKDYIEYLKGDFFDFVYCFIVPRLSIAGFIRREIKKTGSTTAYHYATDSFRKRHDL